MAKTAKRKRSPKRAPAKRGRIVDLMDIPPAKPQTPAELRRGKEALEKFLRKELEPAAPALEQLGRALRTWSQNDPFGVDRLGRLLGPDPALMRNVKLLRAPLKLRGDVEEPPQDKPAELSKHKNSRRRSQQWQQQAVRNVLPELYPPDGKVPDSVYTETVRREVIVKLGHPVGWNTVNRALRRGE